MKQHYCHKCKFDGKASEQCLSCPGYGETSRSYAFQYNDNIEQPESDRAEESPGPDRDAFRKALIEIFSLSPMQLLCLRACMNRQTLTAFAEDMTRFVSEEYARMQKNQAKAITRNRALKVKQQAIRDVPMLASAFKNSLSKRDYNEYDRTER